ncbi:hypothetical protein EJ04DRAFT_598369 [Polyplosphaeria fusca]|uniref:Uncharacterized protein n=1 Tax=Polyplosphaeria fusca TaxID=682080 RepID=A0A9P4QKP0_9PLEO|nr:hypothetical protein EJ04DRAFT_598369 [Polyplosphaeria fusca]
MVQPSSMLGVPIDEDLGGEEDPEEDTLRYQNLSEVPEQTPRARPGRPKGKSRELDPTWKGFQQLKPGEEVPDKKRNNAPRRGPDPNAKKGIDSSAIISEGGRSSRRRDPIRAHAVYLGTFAASLESQRSFDTEPTITTMHRDKLPDPPKLEPANDSSARRRVQEGCAGRIRCLLEDGCLPEDISDARECRSRDSSTHLMGVHLQVRPGWLLDQAQGSHRRERRSAAYLD